MKFVPTLIFIAGVAGIGIFMRKASKNGHSSKVNFLLDKSNEFAKKNMRDVPLDITSDVLVESIKTMTTQLDGEQRR